ncbi:MAG: TetR/AcrR family transcriptional regulator [Pseudomonadota bacterium]
MNETRRRGRPRSFDTDAILDAMAPVFLTHGLAEATLARLEAATGLRRQSLAYAFEDKTGAYLAALSRYADRRVTAVEAALAEDGLAGLADLWVADLARAEAPGCLLVAATSDPEALRVGAMDQVLARAQWRLLRRLAGAVAAGQGDGTVAPGRPVVMGRGLLALGDGLMAQAGRPGLARVAERVLRDHLTRVTLS